MIRIYPPSPSLHTHSSHELLLPSSSSSSSSSWKSSSTYASSTLVITYLNRRFKHLRKAARTSARRTREKSEERPSYFHYDEMGWRRDRKREEYRETGQERRDKDRIRRAKGDRRRGMGNFMNPEPSASGRSEGESKNRRSSVWSCLTMSSSSSTSTGTEGGIKGKRASIISFLRRGREE